MAVCRGLKKCVEYSRFNTKIRIREDPHPLGDLIRHFEAHARDIIRQLIGIFFYHGIEPGTVFLKDFHGQTHGNAVFLEEHHGLAHLLLLFHLFGNRHGHFLTDSLYLG